MRKIVLILLILNLSAPVFACDICGCGAGNNYIGILPDFSKHILGLRYRTNSMITHVGANGTSSYLTTSEQYRNAELWAGWNIGSKFRLMAAIPYAFNERKNQGITSSKNGLGDISAAGYYQLINKRSTAGNNLVVQSLWIGAGIKAPSGKYNPADKSNSTQAANLFQLGTGSTDFSLNGMYDLRIQDAGLSTTINYKINTTNKYEYQYGNKWSANAQFYYKFRIRDLFTIAPNAGAAWERSGKDKDFGYLVDVSGGALLLGTIGTEISFSKLSIGANWQSPMHQDLANGIIKARDRAMIHVSFLL